MVELFKKKVSILWELVISESILFHSVIPGVYLKSINEFYQIYVLFYMSLRVEEST